MTYYGYLGRLRAGQITAITENIAKIDDLSARIDAEDAELADLEAQRKQQVSELESARRKRGEAVASLEEQARSRTARLALLQEQRKQIEQLVKELSRATEAAPYYPDTPFAKLQRKLSWPVAGRIAKNFGLTAAGEISDGVDIDADAGDAVRAVHEGVVVFADWAPGRGLLMIVNHGGGYWTLYGNNAQMFKAVNDKVAAGEKIATVGDTGGRARPGLHFEIRRDGKPQDPRLWFRSSKPPGS